jgi:hypothetical protein
MNLADINTTSTTTPSGMQSPKGINEIASLQKGNTVTPSRQTSTVTNNSSCSPPSAENLLMKQQNSLAFQLSLLDGEEQQLVDEGFESSTSPVSSSSNNNNNISYKVEDIAKLAFPNLPATVSDSSCYKGLTRENKARHVSACETATTTTTSSPSSFGWFVDLDDHHGSPNSTSTPTTSVLTHAVSTDDLAFKAPTAPKRSADDADEIEWAQAADTVDSVLGDLF